MAPALESMRVRMVAEDRQQTAATYNATNMTDYQDAQAGWAQSMYSMASRMAELAVLSSNGTLSQVDRQAFQVEFDQMQQGVQSITSGPYATGKFNGLFIFQG